MLHRCHRPDCRCQKPICVIGRDDFNRPDTSDLSPQWYPYDLGGFNGWYIEGGKLVAGAGYVEFATEDPETADGIRWSARFNFGGQTGAITLQVDRISDSFFHFAVVTCTGATTATVQLYRQESGTPAALTSAFAWPGFNWSNDHTLTVCWGFMGVVPDCSNGAIGWVWTLDYLPDGSPGWQPRTMTGDCNAATGLCLWADPPPVTGDEEEDDTASTPCYAAFGSEGQPVNAINAILDNAPLAALTAPTEPHGGTKVALYRSGGGINFRVLEVKLELLQTGCPKCTTLRTCTNCATMTAPQFLLGELAGVVDSQCHTCTTRNGSYLLQGGLNASTTHNCGQFGLTCAWSGVGDAAPCPPDDEDPPLLPYRMVASIVKNEDDEYFLVATFYADSGTTTQDPTEPDKDPLGMTGQWRKSLGVLESPPDCDELFEEEHVLDYYPCPGIDPELVNCDLTNSTITLRKP